MKLAFDAELESLREEFRKPLADVSLRSSLDWLKTGASLDGALWERLGELGWLGSAIGTQYGGSGLSELLLCVQAEEVGRSLAPIPFLASVCGFSVGVSMAADADACAAVLPKVVNGSLVGVLLTEDCWREPPRFERSASGNGLVSGVTGNVPDGVSASTALAYIDDAEPVIVQLQLSESARESVAGESLDLLHPCVRFRFDRSEARVVASGNDVSTLWKSIVDRYALFTAFEQLGAAAAALEMARKHALQRYAFGRSIASFQALKHTFAGLFVALEIARSNCLFGAAALNSAGHLLHEAAAVARISSTDAFRRCARANMQMHGALGVTWESGCHLYYRRAQMLAGHPGAVDDWKEKLIQALLAAKKLTPVSSLEQR